MHASVKGIETGSKDYEFELVDVLIEMRRGDLCRRTAPLRSTEEEKEEDWKNASTSYAVRHAMHHPVYVCADQ